MLKQIAICLMLASSVHAYANEWIFLVRNSESTKEWHGLGKSYQLRNNKNGDEIVVWTEKESDNKQKKITVQKLYVKTSDCIKKQGKAVVVNMDGDFVYDFDFIFGVETVGSYRAEQLCKIYLENDAAVKSKGI